MVKGILKTELRVARDAKGGSMAHQVSVDPEARAEADSDGGVREIAADLAYQRLAIVNAVFFGRRRAGAGMWVLVDAGVPGSTKALVAAAAERFGKEAAPTAIILTHGHFDHVGALEELAERWEVPVYAHPRELPHLSGEAPYPPPDRGVGGGMVAALARFYPRSPISVSQWLRPLPADGTVPGMPDWRWIHTPGHTSGHVSLWRASDRTLVAGDAFITTAQESAYAVLVQRPELHGPPMYYTEDWQAAEKSVRRLAALEPKLVVSGHGPALAGPEMQSALQTLAREFRRVAVPEQARAVGSAATR